MAHRGGALAIAVTTGVTARETFEAMAKEKRPHLVASDIGEVLRVYRDCLRS